MCRFLRNFCTCVQPRETSGFLHKISGFASGWLLVFFWFWAKNFWFSSGSFRKSEIFKITTCSFSFSYIFPRRFAMGWSMNSMFLVCPKLHSTRLALWVLLNYLISNLKYLNHREFTFLAHNIIKNDTR